MKIMSKTWKNDENNLINDNYQIYKIIFEIILNKDKLLKIKIKHHIISKTTYYYIYIKNITITIIYTLNILIKILPLIVAFEIVKHRNLIHY